MNRNIIIIPLIVLFLIGSCHQWNGSRIMESRSNRPDGPARITSDIDPMINNPSPEKANIDASPGSRENEEVTFVNVSKEVGLAGKNGNYFAWGDYNNDGNTDLLVNGRYLYRNEGEPDFHFTGVTGAANLSGSGVWFSNGVWGDYDNDGWLDIFAGGRGDRLFRNKGDGTFEDVTVLAGVDIDDHPTCAGAWGDFDRDGDLDLYLANGEDWNDGNYIHYPDRMYLNNGDGTFTDITASAGMDTSSSPAYGRGATWGDIDNDGWPDLYVSNYRLKPNYLWYNNRDGTFTDIARDSGCAGLYDTHMFFDGYTNRWYGYQWGHTIGSAMGDLDNDGLLDIWTSNLVHKYVGPTSSPEMPYDIRGYVCDDSRIYRNNGAPTYDFTDVRPESGIPYKPIGDVDPGTPMPNFIGDEFWFNAAFGDFDNDGDLDVFVPQGGSSYYDVPYAYSFLFRNNGDWTFDEIGTNVGMVTWCTYGGSWCDYDKDGDLDLVTSGKSPYVAEGKGTYEIRLYRNSGNSNHWLKIKVMDGDSFAVGAQVRVTTNSGTLLRQVETGTGCYSTQHDIILHFGLGDETSVSRIEIIYNDGTIQVMENVDVDQTLSIDKPTGVPVILALSANVSEVSEAASVTFDVETDLSCPVSWDFDSDGIFDLDTTSWDSPEHTFNISGTFVVKAAAWSPDLLSGSTGTLKIKVNNHIPVANLTGDRKGFEDQELSFSSADSFDTPNDMECMEYFLDFGDGNTTGWVNDTSYCHTYPEMGSYPVILRVRDDDGVVSSAGFNVTIENFVPVPQLFGNTKAVEDEKLFFTGCCNDTLSDMDHIEYAWKFGDGESLDYSSLNATDHTYTDAGMYELVLYVKDRHDTVNSTILRINVSNVRPICISRANATGSEDYPITFSGEGFDTDSDMDRLHYRWDLGDGFVSPWMDDAYYIHTYTQTGFYHAILTVRDDNSETGQFKVNVSIDNVLPSGDLRVQQDVIYEDDEVAFTGSGEDTVSDEDDLRYRMDFGDGAITSWQPEADFHHVYNRSGTYEAVFEIMDNGNGTWSISRSLLVLNRVPVATFSYSPKRDLDKNTEIYFDAGGTTDTGSDMEGLNYSWKMGSEKNMYGKRVHYVFLTSGKHRIELTVSDDDGGRCVFSAVLEIENTPPMAAINISSQRIKAGESVILDGSSSTDTAGDMEGLEYQWRIGSFRSHERKIEYVFKDPGTYTIYLTVTDGDDDSDETSIRLTVSGKNENAKEEGGMGSFVRTISLAILIIIIIALVSFFIYRKHTRSDIVYHNGSEEMKMMYGPDNSPGSTKKGGSADGSFDSTPADSRSTVESDDIPPTDAKSADGMEKIHPDLPSTTEGDPGGDLPIPPPACRKHDVEDNGIPISTEKRSTKVIRRKVVRKVIRKSEIG